MDSSIIKVSFFEPVEGKSDYYFSSLSAIYDLFSPEQVGCSLGRLWASKVRLDNPKVTRTCRISREPLHSKSQTKKRSR